MILPESSGFRDQEAELTFLFPGAYRIFIRLHKTDNFPTTRRALKMRKWIMVLAVLVLMGLAVGSVNAGSGPGPAPSSGDGVPDGSGFPSQPSPGPKGK